jgi:hypothetical protein
MNREAKKSRKTGRQIVADFDRFREVAPQRSREMINVEKRPKFPAK